MADGVLVVDRAGQVHAANPAARRLLAPRGHEPRARRSSCAACRPGAARARRRARLRRGGVARGRARRRARVQPADRAATLRVRVRFTREARAARRARSSASCSCRTCAKWRRARTGEARRDGPHVGRRRARDPQSARRDRAGQRAAGGRPATEPAQRQLSRMVTQERRAPEAHRRRHPGVAPGSAGAVGAIDVDARGRAASAADWAQAAGVAAAARAPAARAAARRPHRCVVRRRPPAPRAGQPAGQRAAPRERQAGRDPRALDRAATRARRALHVWSDGAPIPADVERHLFEPFFSSRSRCDRPGPVHLPRAVRTPRRDASTTGCGRPSERRDGNEFFVDIARAARRRRRSRDSSDATRR